MALAIPSGSRTLSRLLGRLPEEESARLTPYMQRVCLQCGEEICSTPSDAEFAYFPTTSVCSLICDLEDGATSEVSVIGYDGMIGASLFLGGQASVHRTVVGIAGEALRIHSISLRREFQRGGTFQSILLKYTNALITQISLTSACNRMHPLEKRLCRWLLLLRDRARSDELPMTQEFIASVLGGWRETVTVAAGRLQDAGLIQYSRGHIKINDPSGLEQSVCDCYKAIRGEYDRMQAERTDNVVSLGAIRAAGCA